MTSQIQLGAFDIGQRLGTGGMASVYHGMHRRTATPVAVKIFGDPRGQTTKARFRREVEAQAALVHPGVVYLFDYGIINDVAAGQFESYVQPGNPFVAMELAPGGTLQEQTPPTSWAQARAILVQILNALAHAHARGMIHRDLKPANLLIFPNNPPEHRVKLADFGLAHALHDVVDEESEEELKRFAGSARYMAPEQVRSHWREYGPWTDLYAVGCIAWELICGRPPFEAENTLRVAFQHVEDARPPLEPQFEVSAEVQTWVHQAMAIDPVRRFQCAAHALWLLPMAERAEPIDEAIEPAPGTDDAPTEEWIQARTEILLHLAETRDWDSIITEERSSPEQDDLECPRPSSRFIVAPPLPRYWDKQNLDRFAAPLAGAGLGLFGMRELPFVDRDVQRPPLWDGLRHVVENSQLQISLICGAQGVGKTSLAHAFRRRAVEVGAATSLMTIHSPSAGAWTVGLPGMVHRYFLTWNLTRKQCYERILEKLSLTHLPAWSGEGDPFLESDARGLTELLYPTDETGAQDRQGPRFRFSNRRQEFALWERILRRISCDSPTILVVDDLHWGEDVLALLEHLVAVGGDLALMVVATIDTDHQPGASDFHERLQELRDRSHCSRLDLDPLLPDDHRELISRMLPLSEDLEEFLSRQTEGNPLFAHQLLDHWIRTGIATNQGGELALQKDAALSLPDDTHALWMNRLDALVQDESAQNKMLRSLELAAALGRLVDLQEWTHACDLAELPHPAQLIDKLVPRGLLQRTEEGVYFTHGLFVESIERHAREKSRFAQHHRYCAQMLLERYAKTPLRTAQRRADHLIKADELQAALSPLADEIMRSIQLSELKRAQQTIEERADLIERLGLPELAVERLQNEVLKAGLEFKTGMKQASANVEAYLLDLLRRCRAAGDPHVLCEALQVCGMWSRKANRRDEAVDRYQESIEVAQNCGATTTELRAWLMLAWASFYAADYSQSRTFAKKAAALSNATQLEHRRLASTLILGWIDVAQGHYEDAQQRFEKLIDAAQEVGDRGALAESLNGLGDVHRFTGQWDKARANAEHFLELAVEIDHRDMQKVGMLNLAQLSLQDRDFIATEKYLEEYKEHCEKFALQTIPGIVDCIHMALHSGVGNWRALDELLQKYTEGWPENLGVLRDHAWLVSLAAKFAAASNAHSQTQRLIHLARQMWTALGEDESLDEIGT